MATYYVNSATGNDITGTGSSGAPWQTLGHALTNILHGDTLTIAAGTYSPPGSGGAIDSYLIDATSTHSVRATGAVSAGVVSTSLPVILDGTGTMYQTAGIVDAGGVYNRYGILGTGGYGAGPAILTTANTIQVAGCLDFDTGNYYAHGIVDVNEKYYQFGYVDSSGNYSAGVPPTFASPVITNLDLEITPGDAYDSTTAQLATFTDPGNWPTIGSSETKMLIAPLSDPIAPLTSVLCTIAAGPPQTVTPILTASTTIQLVPGAAYCYNIKTNIGNTNTEIRTLASGQITALGNIIPSW